MTRRYIYLLTLAEVRALREAHGFRTAGIGDGLNDAQWKALNSARVAIDKPTIAIETVVNALDVSLSDLYAQNVAEGETARENPYVAGRNRSMRLIERVRSRLLRLAGGKVQPICKHCGRTIVRTRAALDAPPTWFHVFAEKPTYRQLCSDKPNSHSAEPARKDGVQS